MYYDTKRRRQDKLEKKKKKKKGENWLVLLQIASNLVRFQQK